MNNVNKLTDVLNHIKHVFIGKDDIVDLMGICLVARENLFLLGPPGTAKSAIVREFSKCIEDGKNFEYLLTRFTEPNEIFGPFDIRKLKDGELVTNTDGMMPEASVIFLDEIFNANSAILNSLLMALNEKIFRRGKETKKIPALTFIGASNLLPEDEVLNALLDRFLVRVNCNYVDPDLLDQVLIAGRSLETRVSEDELPKISTQVIQSMQEDCLKVDLSPIRKEFISIIHNLRSTGIKVSDRRAVKLQNLIAASALLCNRKQALLSDLWVLRHIWDTEDQIEVLAGIINNIIENEDSEGAHPQASLDSSPNAEILIEEITHLQNKWSTDLPFQQQTAIKDKLRYIQERSEWIQNDVSKSEVQEAIDELWKKILQEA